MPAEPTQLYYMHLLLVPEPFREKNENGACYYEKSQPQKPQRLSHKISADNFKTPCIPEQRNSDDHRKYGRDQDRSGGTVLAVLYVFVLFR